MHVDCYLSQVFLQCIATCPNCSPSGGVYEDFGDCVSTTHLDLTQFQRDSISAAIGQRINSYKPSVVSRHTLEMLNVCDEEPSEKQRLLQYMAAANGVPVPVMKPWLPGTGQKPVVEALLRAHTKPSELRRRGIDSTLIMNVPLTYDMLVASHYTLKEIQAMGFTTDGLVAIGFRAAHLQDRVKTPVRDLVQVFLMSYVTLLDIEGRYLSPVGVLVSYASIRLDIDEHRVLGMTSLKLLAPYGLDRVAMEILADGLSFQDFIDLGMNKKLLSDIGMLTEEGLIALHAPDEPTIRSWLPPGTKLQVDLEAEEERKEQARQEEEQRRGRPNQSAGGQGQSHRHNTWRQPGLRELRFQLGALAPE